MLLCILGSKIILNLEKKYVEYVSFNVVKGKLIHLYDISSVCLHCKIYRKGPSNMGLIYREYYINKPILKQNGFYFADDILSIYFWIMMIVFSLEFHKKWFLRTPLRICHHWLVNPLIAGKHLFLLNTILTRRSVSTMLIRYSLYQTGQFNTEMLRL